MEESKSTFTKRLGIAGAVVSLVGGSIAVWNQMKPEPEIPDLSGEWVITDAISSAADERYVGETHEYVVNVLQDGAKLKGDGKQRLYNGEHAQGKWAVHLDGIVKPEQVTIQYVVNNGAFTGTMRLTVDPEDPHRWMGTNSTTVAEQRGDVVVLIR